MTQRIWTLAPLALAAGLVLAGASGAEAATASTTASPAFQRLDANHDGKITPAELKAARDQQFDRLDTDHDGYLTQAEIAGARAGKAKATRVSSGGPGSRVMKRLDTDHDGKVSKAEFEAGSGQMMARLDKNKDGVITPDEMPRRHATTAG